MLSNMIRNTSQRFQMEMPYFLIRISRCIPSEIEGHALLLILLSASKVTVRFVRRPFLDNIQHSVDAVDKCVGFRHFPKAVCRDLSSLSIM